MGKMPMVLILLFSIFFFHAQGRTITQLNPTNDDPQPAPAPPDLRKEVQNWYDKLGSQELTTEPRTMYLFADAVSNMPNQVQVAKNFTPIFPAYFGMVQAFDYNLTAKLDSDDKLGFAKGFFVESSREDFSALLGMNLVLNEKDEDMKSTITLLGQDSFNEKFRELSIVGGTGKYRLATGSAVMYNLYHVSGIAVVELNLQIRYYMPKQSAATRPAPESQLKQVA